MREVLMWRSVVLVLLASIGLIAGGGCGKSAGGSCVLPADTRSDASPVGCAATRTFEICTGEPMKCSNSCGDRQYAESCYRDQPEDVGSCQIIPVGGPMGWTYYCCPCASP